MTTVEAAEDASEGPASRSGTSEHAVSGHLPVILLVALYVVAVIVYVLLGRGAPVPQVSPDEFTYSSLARSVAEGNGLTWNGARRT